MRESSTMVMPLTRAFDFETALDAFEGLEGSGNFGRTDAVVRGRAAAAWH